MAKLNAMQAAIRAQFTYSIPTRSTISEIQDLLATVFKGGKPPTHDKWFIILLLNVLEGTNYNWLRSSLVGQFTNTKTVPDDKDVIESIIFVGQDCQQKANEQANVARTSKSQRRRMLERKQSVPTPMVTASITQSKNAGRKGEEPHTKLQTGGKSCRL